MAALGHAHHCFRLLVRHADHCGRDGDCRHRVTSGPAATISVVRTGMVLASLQVLLALIGYNWLKLISRFGLPVKVAGILYLFWVLVHGPGASYRPAAALHFHTHLAGLTCWPRCG